MRTQHSRRSFLKAAVVASTLAPCANSWSVAASGSSYLYPGPVVDTHTHFYDPSRPEGVPWPPSNDKLLYRRVLPANYKSLHHQLHVTGTVVVEASPWVEDNEWILNLAVQEKFIVGFIGNLAVGEDGFRKNLRRFSKNPLFRGLRVGADHLRRGLNDSKFLNDLELFAEMDLALDLLGGTEMLPDLPQLARKVPKLRAIIDHVANLSIDGKIPHRDWMEGMARIKELPNIYCKVSGLVEGTGRGDGNAPDTIGWYRPVLDQIWEVFGETRLVYGSNWPVSERFAPCSTIEMLTFTYFSRKSLNALERVFWKNAQAFYRPLDRHE